MAFVFTYGYVIMREKEYDAQAAYLFAYVNGEARSAYRSKFITVWFLTRKGKNYKAVC